MLNAWLILLNVWWWFPYPVDAFVDAVKQVVKANEEFIPPYGTGGSLYLRPFMIGTSSVVGVSPATEYTFHIYATQLVLM